MTFQTLVQRRYDNDSAGITAAISDSLLTQCTKDSLLSDLATALAATNAAGVSSTGFKTILPFEDAHGNMFKVLANLWYAQGHTVMRAWAANPWSYPACYGTPTATPGTMTLNALIGDVRPTLIRVANPTQSTMTVSLTITGLPGSPTPTWATVYSVRWTDTPEMKTAAEIALGDPDWRRDEPIQSRMEEITAVDNKWTMSVLPGLVGEFWINWNCTAPTHTTSPVASVTDGTTTIEIPLAVNTYGVEMPTAKTMAFHSWSRLDTQTNTSVDAKAWLEAHGLNGAHAGGGVVEGESWTSPRVLTKTESPFSLEMNWTLLDAFVALYPNATHYVVWPTLLGRYGIAGQLGIGEWEVTDPPNTNWIHDQIGEEPIDEDLVPRIGEWASQLYAHLVTLGIADKFYLHVFDEPNDATDFANATLYMSAIKAAAPNLLLMGDPEYPAAFVDLSSDTYQDYLANVDMLWVGYSSFVAVADGWNKTQEEAFAVLLAYCAVGVYDYIGPRHGLDPWYVQRMMGVRCYAWGLEGVKYWIITAGNVSGGTFVGDNEYTVTMPKYLCAEPFINSTEMASSKQLEGIRAGQQDYECCKILQDLITAKTGYVNAVAIAAAQAALDAMTALADTTETAYSTYMAWQDAHTTKGDYMSLDDALKAVLAQIESLTNARGAQPPGRLGVLA